MTPRIPTRYEMIQTIITTTDEDTRLGYGPTDRAERLADVILDFFPDPSPDGYDTLHREDECEADENAAYEDGYESGEADGYEKGYEKGYAKGYEDGENGATYDDSF